MPPELGRAGFRIGMYVALISGGLLLVLERGTPEYVISQITFGMGVGFLLFLAVLVKVLNRRDRR